MTDLRDADLSARAEGDLTPAERRELKRRLQTFTTAVKEHELRRRADRAPAKKKSITKWRPPAAKKPAP